MGFLVNWVNTIVKNGESRVEGVEGVKTIEMGLICGYFGLIRVNLGCFGVDMGIIGVVL